MRPTLTKDAIERELSLLYDYEEGMTYAQLGEREDQCRQRIYQRLARARRIRAEIQRQEQASSSLRPDQVGGGDLPYLALTDDRERESGEWYDLGNDDTSVDSGLVRVANGTGHGLRVHGVSEEIGRRKAQVRKPEPPKFKPKNRKKKKDLIQA